MVRQAHGRVADAGRKHFGQRRRKGAVHHGDQQHEVPQDGDHTQPVNGLRVGVVWVARNLQGLGHGAAKGPLTLARLHAGHAGGRLQHDALGADAHHSGCTLAFGRLGVVAHRMRGQHLLGQVAGAGVARGSGGIELEGAAPGRRFNDHLVACLGLRQRRVGRHGQRLKGRKVRGRRQHAAQQDDRLAAHAVGQRTKHNEQRRAQQQRQRQQELCGGGFHLELLRQKEQRIELPGVPDHGLPGRQAQQGQQGQAQVLPCPEGLAHGGARGAPPCLHALEGRCLGQGQANPHRHCQQRDGHQKGNTPAPVGKCVFAQQRTHAHDDQQRHQQAQRGRSLDPGGVGAAPVLGGMFGHIDGGPAILAPQGQALQQAQPYEQDGRRHADAGIGRQQPHCKGGQAHDQHGHQKGVLAPDHVTQPPEQYGPQRAHQKTGGERQQREQKGRARVERAEKLARNDGRQGTVEVKVVPLEHGAQRRGNDHPRLLGRHRPVGSRGGHGLSPIACKLLCGSLQAFLEAVLTPF